MTKHKFIYDKNNLNIKRTREYTAQKEPLRYQEKRKYR